MIPDTASQFRADLLTWAENNLREFPWRDPNASMYEVFIAEFFLTQTPAENVADIYPKFIDQFPSLTAIKEADHDGLVDVIEPLGFHNMRADALKEIAAQYEELPDDEECLVALPQVGPYVANATLCFALNRPQPILDRNVVRTYRRVFGRDFPDERSDRREFTIKMLPEEGQEARTYNLALLDFGALVCTSADPHCQECFASSYCEYYQQQTGAK